MQKKGEDPEAFPFFNDVIKIYFLMNLWVCLGPFPSMVSM